MRGRRRDSGMLITNYGSKVITDAPYEQNACLKSSKNLKDGAIYLQLTLLFDTCTWNDDLIYVCWPHAGRDTKLHCACRAVHKLINLLTICIRSPVRVSLGELSNINFEEICSCRNSFQEDYCLLGTIPRGIHTRANGIYKCDQIRHFHYPLATRSSKREVERSTWGGCWACQQDQIERWVHLHCTYRWVAWMGSFSRIVDYVDTPTYLAQ